MTVSNAEAAGRGIYVYCLARPECVPAVRALVDQDLRGVDERYPVMALEEAGMVAVIGEVDTGDFCDENLQALPWVGPRAVQHEAVVERVMGASPVLPVKFGTIFRNHTSLKEYLGRHREGIERVLDGLRDRAEWSVKGYLAEEQTRRAIAASDAAIRSRVAELSSSTGVRYLQERRLDAVIDGALRTWLTRVTGDLHEALAAHAVASAELRCHASAVTGRPERMVFNCSFLVAPAALSDFRAALSEQERVHDGAGLSLELRGPWPPYNFCPAFLEGMP